MKIDVYTIWTGPTARKQFDLRFIFSQLSTQKILWGIIAVATILRIGSVIYQGNLVTSLPGIYDQISYDGLAQRVMAGYGFSFGEDHWPATRAGEPTAHWSYLYTLYLAVVYTIFGVWPMLARLLQAIIAGGLHSWLVYRLGSRIFGKTIGLVAAAINAIYIYFFYYAGALITETFYIIGILWTFDAALRLVAQRQENQGGTLGLPATWRLWLELGLAISITVLLRQLFLLFVPFLFLWLWWNLAGGTIVRIVRLQWQGFLSWPILQGLLLSTLLIVCMIAPWSLRNYRVFHTFVPLNTNAGYAFFWGNHPIYGTNFVGILPADGPSYYDLIPEELLHLNEAELDRALLKEGIGFIGADPVRYLLLSLSRTREYFKFWPSAESGLISNIARVGSFGFWLPFMLYGLWLSIPIVQQSQRHIQSKAVVLLYLFMLVYSAIHLLSWALIRYRLPVDAVLILFAAVGLVNVAQHVRKRVHPTLLKE